MSSHYTEQDTERARQVEQSSAGVATQQLAYPSATSAAPAAGRNNIPALALIVIGVVLLLGRVAPLRLNFEAGMILLTIASCFLFFSFWKRIYGLMIPGAILAGLSLGVTFADITDGVSVLWGLSLGFLGILFLGRALFQQRSNWPIYPAIPLFAVGTIVAIAQLPSLFAGGLIWLPL